MRQSSNGRDIQLGSNNVIEHDERMVPQYHQNHEIYGEHVARYEAAKPFVRNRVVLDIATGSGYGALLLAETAQKVIGVDVSKNAINYARQHFSAPNIQYKLGDGDKIPLEDDSVEVVASFETIEHIQDYKNFLNEVKRVLKPNGVLLLSTPNDKEFTKGNHFHLHQFTESELQKLLSGYFKNVVPYYQTTWLMNLIGDAESFSQEWKEKVALVQTTKVGRDQALYFYFVCSNASLNQSMDLLGTIGEWWSERGVREKEQLTNNHVRNLEGIVNDQAAYIESVSREKLALEQTLNHYREQWWYKIAYRLKKLYRS